MVQESKLWYDYIIMVLSGNARPYICMRGSAGAPYTSLANHGNNLEKNDLNKSMCEELFGGKLEVTVVPDCFEKSDTRQQKNCLYGTLQIAMKCISTIEEMVQKMDKICRI